MVRLVDPSDNDVPTGMPGELAIRGGTVFSGYWRAEEANACDFRGGWFHMGDVFQRNEDGSLDFVDRVKYMIKSGGENVYPAEIERVLLADKRITEAAVVRAPDTKWGEVPVAFISCRDGSVTEAELKSAAATSPATSARGNSASSISASSHVRPAARCSATSSRLVSPRRREPQQPPRQERHCQQRTPAGRAYSGLAALPPGGRVGRRI